MEPLNPLGSKFFPLKIIAFQKAIFKQDNTFVNAKVVSLAMKMKRIQALQRSICAVPIVHDYEKCLY